LSLPPESSDIKEVSRLANEKVTQFMQGGVHLYRWKASLQPRTSLFYCYKKNLLTNKSRSILSSGAVSITKAGRTILRKKTSLCALIACLLKAKRPISKKNPWSISIFKILIFSFVARIWQENGPFAQNEDFSAFANKN